MDYKIESTPSADQDLDSIIFYLIKEIGSTNAASDFLDEVDACYARLVKMPFMYEMCRDRRLKASGYRRARISSYIMIYRVDEKEHTVYILRFFYSRRDYENLL